MSGLPEGQQMIKNNYVSISHEMLVEMASKWLQKKHPIVITEMGSCAVETPDAIGFDGELTTLIECKASRQDFLNDGKKLYRKRTTGMGNLKYYLAPAGLLALEEIPEPWGLLEAKGYRISVRKVAKLIEKDNKGEMRLLCSAIRRIGHAAPEGISVRCYTIATKNRATLGIEKIIM